MCFLVILFIWVHLCLLLWYHLHIFMGRRYLLIGLWLGHWWIYWTVDRIYFILVLILFQYARCWSVFVLPDCWTSFLFLGWPLGLYLFLTSFWIGFHGLPYHRLLQNLWIAFIFFFHLIFLLVLWFFIRLYKCWFLYLVLPWILFINDVVSIVLDRFISFLLVYC